MTVAVFPHFVFLFLGSQGINDNADVWPMFERRLEELEEAFGTGGQQGERLVILDIGANVGSDTQVCVMAACNLLST